MRIPIKQPVFHGKYPRVFSQMKSFRDPGSPKEVIANINILGVTSIQIILPPGTLKQPFSLNGWKWFFISKDHFFFMDGNGDFHLVFII